MSHPIEQLEAIMAQLRDPELGCPWDRQQSFDTIIPHTIEETYEVVDAIQSRDWDNLCEELGDFVFQAIFYSQLAKEAGLFEFEDVIRGVNEKLIRRHPHVFSDENIDDEAHLNTRWDQIKALEKQEKKRALTEAGEAAPESIFDGVPRALPPLNKAYKLQSRAAKHGFDWESLPPVLDKIREELDEVIEELATPEMNHTRVEAEVGDLLFAVVNLARHLKVQPENALAKTNHKFVARFQGIEHLCRAQGKSLKSCTLAELDAMWEQMKAEMPE